MYIEFAQIAAVFVLHAPKAKGFYLVEYIMVAFVELPQKLCMRVVPKQYELLQCAAFWKVYVLLQICYAA